MALINCPECDKEVSDQSFTCTSCGVELRKKTRSVLGKIIKVIFIFFNILMIISLLNTCDTASQIDGGAEAVGASLGYFMIFSFWAVVDIVLGMAVLLTRPK